MKILALGEIIFDIFNGEAEIGGAPLNFCAHCASIGAETAIISAVGNDSLGKDALSAISSFGIDSGFVQKNNMPTGQCLVTVSNGAPEYCVIRPTAYDKIQITDEMIERISGYGADVFAFGTLIQRDEISREAVKNILEHCGFRNVFCDINLRKDCFDKESCKRCLENATILKISAEEEPMLADFGLYETSESDKQTVMNICKAFDNIDIVLFTKGENGSLVFSKTETRFYEFEAEKTEVVSTVGAGDSYSAAFICEYLKSGDILTAGTAGSKLSSFVVSHREAIPVI